MRSSSCSVKIILSPFTSSALLLSLSDQSKWLQLYWEYKADVRQKAEGSTSDPLQTEQDIEK